MCRHSRACAAAVLLACILSAALPASADPIGLQWAQPSGKGTDVLITYSFSNLFDGAFLLIAPADLRAATEEALALWAGVAPLHFIERPDSGPPPSDRPYPARGHPRIRIGHHSMGDWAHAFYPGAWDGLAGDIHFASGAPWTLDGSTPWNFLEVMTHELGHALGLDHELDQLAIMNPIFHARRFSGLGSAVLLPADVEDIQAIYGGAEGSVQPLDPVPEPAALILLTSGLIGVVGLARRRS